MMASKTEFRGTLTAQILPLVSAAAFFALGLLCGQSPALSYFLSAIAILIGIATILNIIWPPTLILSNEDFTWRSWRYTASYRWSDIEMIAPSSRPGGLLFPRPKITFNFVAGRVPSQIAATAVNRRTNGWDRSMQNVWALPSDELASRMNSFRLEAIHQEQA